MATSVKNSTEQAWKATLGELGLQMTKATFNTWLKDTSVLRVENGVYIIGVRNQYAQDWLKNRLIDSIQRTLMAIDETAVAVRFEVVDGAEGEPDQADELDGSERPSYSRRDVSDQWYVVLKAYAEAQTSLQPKSCLQLLHKLDYLLPDGTNLQLFSADPSVLENLNRIANWQPQLQLEFHKAGLFVDLSLLPPQANGQANGKASRGKKPKVGSGNGRSNGEDESPVRYRNIRPPTDPLGSFVKTSHYAMRFWRPYLGADVFDLLQIISSYAYEFEVLRKDGPTLKTLIHKLGRGGDTRKLTGRPGSGKEETYRDGSYGWLNELRDHRLCDHWTDGHGRGAKQYFDHLTKVSDLPLLTPKQVSALSKDDQAEHEEWLRIHTGIDYDEWLADDRETRVLALPVREDG